MSNQEAQADELKISLVRRTGLWLAFAAIAYACSSAMAAGQMPPPVNSLSDAQRLSESVADKHGFLTSGDGTCLFYRYWPAGASASSERVVVVLHGIGYHSGPYKVIADALNPRGINVFALDDRAHGLSCGRRGYLGTPIQVADDVATIVRFAKKEWPAAKIYLLGESMGGAFALNYVRENGSQINGLILLAPAIDVYKRQLFNIGNLGLLPYLLFAHRTPVISLVGKRLEESSGDPQFIAARRTDPLAYKKVSFGYLWDIKHLVRNWNSEIAPDLTMPTLIVKGGKDVIVSHKGSEILARTKGTSGTSDRQYKVFPEARHTTLWDPDTPEILEFVAQWILDH
jgi:alpha-beta hydrolase superfamily lysophospholipase